MKRVYYVMSNSAPRRLCQPFSGFINVSENKYIMGKAGALGSNPSANPTAGGGIHGGSANNVFYYFK